MTARPPSPIFVCRPSPVFVCRQSSRLWSPLHSCTAGRKGKPRRAWNGDCGSTGDRVPDPGSRPTASIAAIANICSAIARAATSLIPRPVNTEVLVTETAEDSPVGELKSRAGGHLVPDSAVEVDKRDMGGCLLALARLVKFVEVLAEFAQQMARP